MGLFRKKRAYETVPTECLPQHIGIIMDGNGRWASKRGLPRQVGHVTGARVFRKIVKYCEKRGIGYVTVYAFSTENWRRPQQEVDAIMDLLRQYLRESLDDFQNENIVVRFIGDTTVLADDIQQLIREAQEVTSDKTGLVLNIAVNYGGRDDIVYAVRQIAQKAADGNLTAESVTEETISQFVYTAGQPDPDMILRPSGEYRLSNFMIWQAAYAEFVYMDILWPDFDEKDMEQALRMYAGRQRRFGGVEAKK
jgi:undecaprenyl diphosphate synthase